MRDYTSYYMCTSCTAIQNMLETWYIATCSTAPKMRMSQLNYIISACIRGVVLNSIVIDERAIYI